MIQSQKFIDAISLFDKSNDNDPNKESFEGKEYSKELLYAIRMTQRLGEFSPEAEESLKLAVRCQHIRRWEIPREDYEMNRVGYLTWRNDLKIFHADIASEILTEVGYENELIESVRFLLLKKQLKQNEMTQTLEDVICLVFLEFYFEKFSKKYSEEKTVDILKKTWNKMSVKGQKSALKIQMSNHSQELLTKVLA